MKTNVNALKDLFVKYGGSLATVYDDISPDPVGEYVSISAMIEACSKVAGGGGESNVEAIAITIDGTTLSTELTSGEIIELAESGKILVCVNDLTEAGQGVQFYPVGLVSSNPNAMCAFVINGTEETVIAYKLSALTDSDPFSMTLGG